MIRKIYIAILMVMVVGSVLSQTVSLDDAIETAARNIEKNIPEGTKVAVLNFTSESEQFSDYVIEELAISLVNGKKVSVVDRRDTELIRQEMNFQLSGNVSDESAQRIGAMLGAQVIVSGSLVDTGIWYRFRVNTINVETAVRLASTSVNISGKDSQVVFFLTGKRLSPEETIIPMVSTPLPISEPVFQQSTPSPIIELEKLDPSKLEGFAFIKGGTFLMGSPETEQDRSNDEVQHEVTVKDFYLSMSRGNSGGIWKFTAL